MPILQEVLAWSKTIPPWQSDAVARLFAKQLLSIDDLKDMLALLKSANGIEDAEKRVAKPLETEQIPAPAKVKDQITLLAIKNFRNVNAIAEGGTLTIGHKGLTVVYGDNGLAPHGLSTTTLPKTSSVTGSLMSSLVTAASFTSCRQVNITTVALRRWIKCGAQLITVRPSWSNRTL